MAYAAVIEARKAAEANQEQVREAVRLGLQMRREENERKAAQMQVRVSSTEQLIAKANLADREDETENVLSGEIYNCDCGGDEVSGHSFGCRRIQESVAMRGPCADTEALKHLQNVMGYIDTPICRRRLNIDPDQPPEWLSQAREFLKKANP